MKSVHCILSSGSERDRPGVLPQATEPFCILVEALRPIKAGEELLIDYGPEYNWAVDDEPPLSALLRRLKVSYL